MTQTTPPRLTRRALTLGAAAAILTAPQLARATTPDSVRRNMTGFRALDWRNHFDSLGKGVLIADTEARVLHHWTSDEELRIYPTSVPMSDELTRRGFTEVTLKDPAPDWVPTPSMRERDPSLPARVPPGPDSPLGVRALHLGWKYYRIHGTQDTRKIGRQASSGCIGLYNEHILEVYERTPVGAQVLLL